MSYDRAKFPAEPAEEKFLAGCGALMVVAAGLGLAALICWVLKS